MSVWPYLILSYPLEKMIGMDMNSSNSGSRKTVEKHCTNIAQTLHKRAQNRAKTLHSDLSLSCRPSPDAKLWFQVLHVLMSYQTPNYWPVSCLVFSVARAEHICVWRSTLHTARWHTANLTVYCSTTIWWSSILWKTVEKQWKTHHKTMEFKS